MSDFKPGIHSGVPFAAYCDIDALNVSRLLHLAGNTPEGALWKMTHEGNETEALLKGHATHAAILEPKVFADLYATMPEFGDLRVKANKESKTAWLAEHKESIALSTDEYGTAIAIRDRLARTPYLNDLFAGPGQNELTVLWTEKDTGLPCKARIDRISNYMGWQTLIDLKTARAIGDYDVQTAIAKYNYHVRMAWYVDALNAIHQSEWRVVLVWGCTEAPYEMRATELDEDALNEGRAMYRVLLERYASCKESGKWPSYAEGIDVVTLPKWKFNYTSPDLGA